jgi:hypothetical protein
VTSLGAPRITVMYSVCILIYVSMYLYSNPSMHAISGLAAGGAWEQFEVRLENDDRVNSEIYSEAVIEQLWRCTWRR